jgi:DNA repair exonuclease SbcCD ATPase subunit
MNPLDLTQSFGITFTKLRFKNFMSFGNLWTEVSLDTPGTTLLMGENLDTGGSSGAGKSTLINAISYCLYDKIPSKVSKDRLINRTNDKKNTLMEIQIFFTKGTDLYEVRRWRGSETGVKLLLNGSDITPASVNRGEDSFNAKVEDILGFSYNLFTMIILFNGNSDLFLDQSVGAQRQLTEELLRITILTKKANALKKEASETDKSISMQKLLIQQQQKQREIQLRHITDATDRHEKWDRDQVTKIEKLNAEIEALSKVDYDGEEAVLLSIGDLEKSRNDLNAQCREIMLTIRAKQSESFPKNTQIEITKREIKKLESDIKKLEGELSHLVEAKCPYCLQKYEDATAKIEETQRILDEKKVEQSLLESKLSGLEKESDEFEQLKDSTLVELRSSETELKLKAAEAQRELEEITNNLTFKSLSELHEAKSLVTKKQVQLQTAVGEENPHTAALMSLSTEELVEINTTDLDELQRFYEHQNFLIKLLTDKNSFIRKGIISKTIPFLNKRIAYYTEKLNLPHVVVFQPDMSCEITEIGRELDHGNLSNGEKKRLNLALCLSFRDVLTYLHSKVNVLFTDEIDGGSISGPDADALVSMIKSKAWDDDISIFVISHRPEFEGRCDRNLVIRKDGGFSTLIEQPD